MSVIEQVALAMAASEGNTDAQARAHPNYDVLGYTGLAKAAVGELERLGLLPGSATTDATAGAADKP